MKRKVFLIFSIFFLCFSLMAQEFTLVLGKQKVIPAQGVKSVSSGNPRIVRIVIPKDQSNIILKAVGAGTTTVTLIKQDGSTEELTVNVIAHDPQKIKKEVEQLLEGVEGIEIKIVGDKVIIDGEILTEKDNKRIDKVLKLYGDQVVKFAEFNKAYLPKEDNIMVEFNFCEVNTKKMGNYGINWNQAIKPLSVEYAKNFSSGDVVKSTIGIVSNFGQAINIMVGNGDAKVYDTHRVITVSGQPAEYFVGGEFGTRNITQDTSSVVWKKYGTKFVVTPEIDSLNNMRIKIDSEISELSGVSVDGIPALNTRKINTIVRIKEGQTIALGGFIKRIKSQDIQKVPGLGSVPVLGALFRSKNYQNGVTDGVIFITAKRISAEDQEMKQMIDKPLKEFHKEKKKWWQRDKK